MLKERIISFFLLRGNTIYEVVTVPVEYGVYEKMIK